MTGLGVRCWTAEVGVARVLMKRGCGIVDVNGRGAAEPSWGEDVMSRGEEADGLMSRG